MKEYLASRLVRISHSLTQCGLVGLVTARAGADFSDDDRKVLDAHFTLIAHELQFLGLKITRASVLRAQSKVPTIKTKDLVHELDIIEGRLDDEISTLHLFYVPEDKIAYYNRSDLLGLEFKQAFPTANVEAIEAGNCLAFDRYAACVFHLMRSLEVVLKSLFEAIGLPPLTTTGERNWNGILRRIRDKLDTDKGRADFDFYDAAYAFLAAAKNPIRNATMHVDASYDEASARTVFDAVGAFMRHAATKLKES